jgi:hypothetical protein
MMRRRGFRKPWTGVLGPWLLLVVAVTTARAHVSSTGFVELHAAGGALRADVILAVRDLDDLLGLDANHDGFVVWGEVRAREADMVRYVRERVRLSFPDGVWTGAFTNILADRRTEGNYVLLRREGRLPERGPLILDYDAFAERDPMHRALVKFVQGEDVVTAVMGPEARRKDFPISGAAGLSASGFLKEGVHHIWTGYDHLAFLLALLLPSVLRRSAAGWTPVEGLRAAVLPVLGIVTAFTAAHSVTLALAALEIVRLPSRFVESVIAASIAVAVIPNFFGTKPPAGKASSLSGWLRERPALVAFGFGLVHGFGFAGVLGEFGLRRPGIVAPLVAFNAGVELGQLACVAVFVPAAFALRRTTSYRRVFVPAASAGIGLLACLWFVDRVLDRGFMPF